MPDINKSNVSTGKPKVTGSIYRAVLGTTLPTSASETLNAAFKAMGYVSADGVTNANKISTSAIKAWGGDTVMVSQTDKTDTFSFTLIESLNTDVVSAIFGTANVTGAIATGLTVKATVTFQVWEGDWARFNGEAEFDACDALDSMDDDQIAQIERGESDALNEVYRTAVRLGQIHDYDGGPVKVELDEDHLSDYLEARRNG